MLTKSNIVRFILFLFVMVTAVAFLLPIAGTFTNAFMSEGELVLRYSPASAAGVSGDGWFSVPRGFGLVPFPLSVEQFKNVLIRDSKYLFMFWRSVFLALASVVPHILISLPVGFALAKARVPGKRVIMLLLAIVMVMPFSVTMLPNYIMARFLHTYNTDLALILPAIFAPMGFLLIYGFANDIPNELVEALLLDTSSYLRVIWNLVLPLLRPAIAVLFILAFSESWGMVEQPLVLFEDFLKYPLSATLNRYSSVSSAFAASVIYFLPILSLVLMFEGEIETELSSLVQSKY